MKKLLVILLAMCLVVMSVVPAFAADVQTAVVATVDEVEPQSNAQVIYAAFLAVDTALQGSDIDALNKAVEDFAEVSNKFEDLTDEEFEELKALLGVTTNEEYFDVMLGEIIFAGSVLTVSEFYEDFKNSPNTETALAFVEEYNYIFNDPDYADDELKATVKRFIPDIDEAYAQASLLLPTDRVLALYYGYYNVLYAWELGELEVAHNELVDAIINADELTDEEYAQLGELFDMDGEEAYSEILNASANANCTLVLAEHYDAFLADKNKDTASNLVMQYEVLFLNEEYYDEELCSYIYDFIYDIDEVYEEAKALLEAQPQEGEESKKDEDKSTQANTAAVKTGDFVSAYLYAFALLSLVAGLSLVFFKKRAK